MDIMDTSYAEGRVFDFEKEDKIGTGLLESFPYDGPRQKIQYETAEFSAVCPYSGLPDYGRLRIDYIPGKTILELKSFKYYIVSFRNVGIFQEPVTARIFKDILGLLQPQWLCVTTTYNTRGGIDSTCVIDSSDQ
jgi:7-cyano-7-deazaguanine reductase